MLKIDNLKISLVEGNKEIVHGISLTVNPGEVHFINGNNGSGKSTIVNFLMGNPNFKSSGGEVTFSTKDVSDFILEKIDPDSILSNNLVNVLEISATERSLLGFFLANQYPVEIPGVSLRSYLRLIYNARLQKEAKASVFEFKKLLEQKANLINYPLSLLDRNLNEGFSGGEKKKTEILQMLLLNPRIAMLDEIDSGLDKNAVKDVFSALKKFKEESPTCSLIVISHYDSINNYLNADFVHTLDKGLFV